jgi:hypothetical protein
MSVDRSRPPAPWWDAPLTVALLVLGVISVTNAVAAGRDLNGYLQQSYAAAGLGEFTPSALVTGLGYAIVVVELAALVVAIGFAVPRIRTHRRAFWVPLIAGSAATAVTLALLLLAIDTDPGSLPSPTSTSTQLRLFP